MASTQQVQIKVTGQYAADPAFKAAISDLKNVGVAAQEAGGKLKQMSGEKVTVAVDTQQAEQGVDKLEKMIVRIAGQDVQIPVDADLNPALAEMAKAEKEARALEAIKPTIDIHADAQQAVQEIEKVSNASSMLGTQAAAGLGQFKGAILGVAGGVALANVALGAVSKGLGFLKDSVFGANNQMDQTRATLMAITKDGGETSRIIGMINQEAARTPYVFGEMASTYTALLPLSKQYNTSLQELVETAELLAASKPEQGLAGAAFSLREAMSGDYMSLISRFDLPRQYINQLKAEGVPALEIVRQAMGQMGYDSDIMARRAETMTAQWDTFFDDIRINIATKAAPFVQWLSSTALEAAKGLAETTGNVLHGLGEVGQALADLPPITIIKLALETGGDERAWDFIRSVYKNTPVLGSGTQAIKDVAATAEAYNDFQEKRQRQEEVYVNTVHQVGSAYQQYIDTAIAGSGYMIADQNELNQQAEAYHFAIQQQESAIRRRNEASRDAAAAEEEYLAATKGDRAMSRLRDENMDANLYVSTLDAQAAAAFRAAEANSTLVITQDRLRDAYAQGLKVQSEYTAQGSEYASQASNIEKALAVVQKKQEEGITLSEQEIFIRDHATEALARYKGGQDDAAMTAGEYAIRNGMVMEAQDQLNEALGRGEISQDEYAQKMRDAYAAAGLTYDATANNSTIMGTMASTIATQLVPAILDLIRKLDEINGKKVVATVETNFITTGDVVTGQMYGQSVSGTHVGVTAGNAAGGIIDRPMLSMVGEEAPAHPEFIIPTNPSRRGRAVGLWLSAGRSLGVPGFADGGGPGGGGGSGGGSSSPGSIDWSWLFKGLDTEAENYTSRAAEAFVILFRDIEDLASGAAGKRAQQELDRLMTVRQIAIDTGAGDAVVAGLDAQVAEQQSKVEAIGAAMGTDIVAGIRDQMTSADLATALAEAVSSAWTSALGDLDSILSGEHEAKLQKRLSDLETELQLALAGGAPDDVVAKLRETIAAVQRELAATQTIYSEAAKAGLIDTTPYEIPLEKIAEIIPQMKDGGLSMIDELVRGVAEGTAGFDGVLGLIDEMIATNSGKWSSDIGGAAGAIVEELNRVKQALLDDLAQALIDGTDPAEIQQNLLIVEQLLDDTEKKVKKVSASVARALDGPSVQARANPSGLESGGGVGGLGGGGGPINLMMPNGAMVAAWYAREAAADALLAPSAIGVA